MDDDLDYAPAIHETNGAMTFNEVRAVAKEATQAAFARLRDQTLFGIPFTATTRIDATLPKEPKDPDLGDQALFGRHGREGSPEHRAARRPLKERRWFSTAADTKAGGTYGRPMRCPYCGDVAYGVDACDPPVHMACDGEALVRVGAEGDNDERAYERPGYLLHDVADDRLPRRTPSWRNQRAHRTNTREMRSTGVDFFADGSPCAGTPAAFRLKKPDGVW